MQQRSFKATKFLRSTSFHYPHASEIPGAPHNKQVVALVRYCSQKSNLASNTVFELTLPNPVPSRPTQISLAPAHPNNQINAPCQAQLDLPSHVKNASYASDSSTVKSQFQLAPSQMNCILILISKRMPGFAGYSCIARATIAHKTMHNIKTCTC
jgi:hypothetical protein